MFHSPKTFLNKNFIDKSFLINSNRQNNIVFLGTYLTLILPLPEVRPQILGFTANIYIYWVSSLTLSELICHYLKVETISF